MNPDQSSINEASNKVRLFFMLMSAVLIIEVAASYFAGRAALDAIARIREFDAATRRSRTYVALFRMPTPAKEGIS